MRKLFVSNVMSLDGFFETENRGLDFFARDEEFFAYAREMLRSVDTILFGRLTYEVMAAYWPKAEKDEIADQMNGLQKVVFSKTLGKADWNNSRIAKGDIVEEVARLKQHPGKDIVILGSARLASYLLEQGPVDEYRVIMNPVLIGRGHGLFRDVKNKISLKLTNTKQFASGVVVLYYQKA